MAFCFFTFGFCAKIGTLIGIFLEITATVVLPLFIFASCTKSGKPDEQAAESSTSKKPEDQTPAGGETVKIPEEGAKAVPAATADEANPEKLSIAEQNVEESDTYYGMVSSIAFPRVDEKGSPKAKKSGKASAEDAAEKQSSAKTQSQETSSRRSVRTPKKSKKSKASKKSEKPHEKKD